MTMSAETKAHRRLNALKSIARQMKVTTHCSTPGLSSVLISVDGITLSGIVRDINPVLEKLGYRPVRITHNILNKDAGFWAIDINTPSYCDPGCESYHSM